MYPVETIDAPQRRIAAMSHKGPYHQIGATYAKLAAVLGQRQMFRHAQGMLAVYYDDPDATKAADLSSHAGVIMPPEVEISDPLEDVIVAGGRLAVMHFKGPYAGLPAAYNYLYGDWLRQSEAKLRDAPSFELYLNDPSDTAPEDLLTDICVPIT